MDTTTENPLATVAIPEGFTREEIRGVGQCLICKATKTTINWTRHYERLSNGKAAGPFHVQNYKRGKLDRWAATLEEAIEIARR